MKEATLTVKPYDRDAADEVFSVLFYGSEIETEEGLRELPAASYQLVVSALELIRWDVNGEDYKTITKAMGIVAGLRDKQKMREWKRRGV